MVFGATACIPVARALEKVDIRLPHVVHTLDTCASEDNKVDHAEDTRLHEQEENHAPSHQNVHLHRLCDL